MTPYPEDGFLVIPVQQCCRWSAEVVNEVPAEAWLKPRWRIRWDCHQSAVDTYCNGEYSRWFQVLIHLCFEKVEQTAMLVVTGARRPQNLQATFDRIFRWKDKIVFKQSVEGGHWTACKLEAQPQPGNYCCILGCAGNVTTRRIVTLFSKRWVSVEYKHFPSNEFEELFAPRPQEARDDLPLDISPAFPFAGEEQLEEYPNLEVWHQALMLEREKFAEEVRTGEADGDFSVQSSLRITWVREQKADPELAPLFLRTPEEYRVAEDGLLERAVSVKNQGNLWVPVVPSGYVGAHMSWRRWVFLQSHSGLFGAHRSAEKTIDIMRPMVYWRSMDVEVKAWVDACLTCIKTRKRPTKQEAVAVKPSGLHCWQEVMVDMEGPNPPDREGNRWVLTYFDCLSHGVLLEPLKRLTHSEVRRAFARAIFRARTIPVLLRTDRGQEFRNTLLAEFVALMGMQHKFSTAMRPCEMGANERMHQETQKLMGILLNDVARGQPSDWGEFLVVIEFVVENTPGPHGWAPRDLERRWSVALPLEKDLLPLDMLQFEPVSEYARSLFQQYREVKVKVMEYWKNSSEARARLANRFRKQLTLRPGDRVVYRDPKVRSEGRVPWKRAMTGPWVVVSTQGNKAVIEDRSDPRSPRRVEGTWSL